MSEDQNTLNSVVEIISAYVTKNPVPASEVPSLIQSVHRSLTSLGQKDDIQKDEPKAPAVSVKKSISADYIICLEDGLKFKSLKRHLRTKYGMSPEEYREKWKLPADYPMVAPAYAEARSNLAKKMGLGTDRTGGRKPGRKKSVTN